MASRNEAKLHDAMRHAHFMDTPTFIVTDAVESVADPDWKKGGVYTIYRFGLVLTRICSLQFL